MVGSLSRPLLLPGYSEMAKCQPEEGESGSEVSLRGAKESEIKEIRRGKERQLASRTHLKTLLLLERLFRIFECLGRLTFSS